MKIQRVRQACMQAARVGGALVLRVETAREGGYGEEDETDFV